MISGDTAAWCVYMLEREGEPAEPPPPPAPPRHPRDPIVSAALVPHLSPRRLLLGPRDPQRLLHVPPHLSSQAAALMCLTVLFVILQSRVLALQSGGGKNNVRHRMGRGQKQALGGTWRRSAARPAETRKRNRAIGGKSEPYSLPSRGWLHPRELCVCVCVCGHLCHHSVTVRRQDDGVALQG